MSPLLIEDVEVPLNPPADWFAPPADGIPTDRRLTVDAGGRVYGYIALWNACHVGAEGCVRPPKGSPSDYELSHPGQTLTAEGDVIKTGNIGGDVGHAPGDLNPWDAAEFYENVATQMMRVRYGEDENGLWFAGALWPTLTDEDVARLMASSISGDWRWEASWRRTDDGGFDYTGAVLVNLPGFPLEAEGGASTEGGFLQSIAASARKDGFHGIVSWGDEYLDLDAKDTTMAEPNSNDPITATGGGCGCGGGGKTIKAGQFEGTVGELASLIGQHIEMALAEAGATDDAAGDGDEPVEVMLEVEDVAAAVRAAVEGGDASSAEAVEALNMKLDTLLERTHVIEAAVLEEQAERLASKAQV